AATRLGELQEHDGSVQDAALHSEAGDLVEKLTDGIRHLTPLFPHDEAYLTALVADFQRWSSESFGVPDFLDSLVKFDHSVHRVELLRRLVLVLKYPQNASNDRHVAALILELVWPAFVAELAAGAYSTKLFDPEMFVDCPHAYVTTAAVLFP